jgi:hypothetical protein
VTDENVHSEWEMEGSGEGSNAGESEQELR